MMPLLLHCEPTCTISADRGLGIRPSSLAKPRNLLTKTKGAYHTYRSSAAPYSSPFYYRFMNITTSLTADLTIR